MAYEVRLEVFEGPIDLLLHLITRQRVDIYDVSLARITEEYLAAIADVDIVDLETATGFLVVAATLLELKSARLLPSRRADEVEAALLEERDLLLARLVECATYREAGMYLGVGLKRGEAWLPRDVTLEPQFVNLAPDLLAHVGLDDLRRAAELVLAPKPEPELDTSHVAPIVASVRDAIVEMAERLASGTPTSFESLCGRQLDKIEIVVRFLALLELFKAGAVAIDQVDRFGDIRASWTGEASVDEVIADAEEYTAQGEGVK
ncbi:MAG: segregation and condensation protein A [Actinomycetota bacterium]